MIMLMDMPRDPYCRASTAEGGFVRTRPMNVEVPTVAHVHRCDTLSDPSADHINEC